jgi:hypothetical protein
VAADRQQLDEDRRAFEAEKRQFFDDKQKWLDERDKANTTTTSSGKPVISYVALNRFVVSSSPRPLRRRLRHSPALLVSPARCRQIIFTVWRA